MTGRLRFSYDQLWARMVACLLMANAFWYGIGSPVLGALERLLAGILIDTPFYGLPVLGAGQEWRAIQRLTEAGVPTMTAVAYGERGSNPAAQHSFIVTEELAPTTDLEQLTLNWAQQPPAARLKRALIAEVAKMVGGMHRAGVNHRDCYICHFLLHTDKAVTADDFRLSVIDLHRAQVRSAVPLRWRNKDLAALYFSALDIGLTRRDTLRFLRTYFQRPLRDILRDEARLLAWLERKADKLYARKQRYGDAL